MVSMSTAVFVIALIWVFIVGCCVGALIIYRREETAFKAMIEQCRTLEETNKTLIAEREEYRKTHEMLTVIDDVPEYLNDKYDIFEKRTFTEGDEDISEIYI